MTTRRAMVIGFGYAGRRFARVLEHISRDHDLPVELVGVVERKLVEVDGLPVFGTVAHGLRESAPDVVCVSVNEEQHEAVFDELADYGPSLVLSEKPLTTDLASAVRVVKNLRGHQFSMNLVERFSPLVPRFRAWADQQPDLSVVRVEAHWGKHRIFDPRPTMGVLSELIHPLDLIQHLFMPLDTVSVHAQAVISDLDVTGRPRLDTIDVNFDMAGSPVLLHSSYAWPDRVRTVTALVRSGARMFRVLFTFDQPHWDCDSLEIREITEDGRWRPLMQAHVDVADVPEPIAGVGKMHTFVRRSLGLPVPGWPDCDDLVGLDAALELQRLIEGIADAAVDSTALARYREAGR
ncbi:MAG: Gfo/Idh/MocA family oxidoreductase [Mycobacterium sp.]|uniref:Gfo/Idh/MocA family protein n=1 Tax=Mycobacterium sp. TaxID=1785 RepID=UPI003C983025